MISHNIDALSYLCCLCVCIGVVGQRSELYDSSNTEDDWSGDCHSERVYPGDDTR